MNEDLQVRYIGTLGLCLIHQNSQEYLSKYNSLDPWQWTRKPCLIQSERPSATSCWQKFKSALILLLAFRARQTIIHALIAMLIRQNWDTVLCYGVEIRLHNQNVGLTYPTMFGQSDL